MSFRGLANLRVQGCIAVCGLVGACGATSTGQQVIYIPTAYGVEAQTVSSDGSPADENDLKVFGGPETGNSSSRFGEFLRRIDDLGWPCFDFARRVSPTFGQPYSPAVGDIVYRAGSSDDLNSWQVTSRNDLELRCLLVAQVSDSRETDRETPFVREFSQVLGNSEYSEERVHALRDIRTLVQPFDVYDRDDSYLSNIAVELLRPEALFSLPSHGLNSCGQANCRLLTRTCGRTLYGRNDDLDLIDEYRLLCGLKWASDVVEVRRSE